jgi:hypothetical protein
MFGVNEKFGLINAFYCPALQSNREDQMGTIEQEKALFLLKALTSKFYISSNRPKRIILSSKSLNPVSVDVSKP